MNTIKVGMTVEQVKPITEFGFDYVGTRFLVDSINEKAIFCKGNGVGFGISPEELETYFKVINSNENKVETYEDCKVIRNDKVTVVILSDGTKGVSKCLPEDSYDEEKGFEIAYTKAQIKSLTKKLKKLSK